MYYFLGYKEMIIDGMPWYKVFILFYDKCCVTSYYIPKDEDNEEFVNSFNRFEDITDRVRFSVKRNGSVSIYLTSN